jgi:hypothetical protein
MPGGGTRPTMTSMPKAITRPTMTSIKVQRPPLKPKLAPAAA